MDANIPAEAVEAATRQVHARFASYTFIEQQNAREAATAALNAAAPLIEAAAYERAKNELDRLSNMVDAIGDDDYESDDSDGECPCGGNCHTAEAVATYARVGSVLTHWAAELRAQL